MKKRLTCTAITIVSVAALFTLTTSLNQQDVAKLPGRKLAGPSGTTAASPDDVTTGRSESQRPRLQTPRTYAVVRVVDGDTVHVSYHSDTTVRIIGINTPETVDPNEPVQCGGPAASHEAHRLLDGQRVKLIFDPTQDRVDAYGRTLAYLQVPGIGDYGQYMINHGYAFEYTYHTPYRRRNSYLAAQSYAQAHHLGLWGRCNGTLTPLGKAADSQLRPSLPTLRLATLPSRRVVG